MSCDCAGGSRFLRFLRPLWSNHPQMCMDSKIRLLGFCSFRYAVASGRYFCQQTVWFLSHVSCLRLEQHLYVKLWKRCSMKPLSRLEQNHSWLNCVFEIKPQSLTSETPPLFKTEGTEQLNFCYIWLCFSVGCAHPFR